MAALDTEAASEAYRRLDVVEKEEARALLDALD
jgi:hypothetical protein